MTLNPKRIRFDGQETGMLTDESLISTADFGRPLDIKALEKHYSEVKPNEVKFSEKFQGLHLTRYGPDKISGLVFPTGKILLSGAKTEEVAKTSITSMLNVVRQIVYPGKSSLPPPEPAKTQGIIASFSTGFPIQLERLALDNPKIVIYEPEIFKPLIFVIESQTKVVAFISAKGKVLLTGAKFRDVLDDAHKRLLTVLLKYRKD